jgi:hypothetical protein
MNETQLWAFQKKASYCIKYDLEELDICTCMNVNKTLNPELASKCEDWFSQFNDEELMEVILEGLRCREIEDGFLNDFEMPADY